MEFSNEEFKNFRKDVLNTLKIIEEKYSVTIDVGNIRYRAFDFDMKLNVVKNDTAVDGKRALFEQDCISYGFAASDYEKEFVLGKDKFKLIGFNRKARTNTCMLCRVSDGKMYTANEDIVKKALSSQEEN